MKGLSEKISPLEHHISFNKLLKQYDEMAQSEDSFLATKARYILDAQAPFPELREGFTDIAILEKHKDVIQIILQDLFSSVLTANEIKTASFPCHRRISYSTPVGALKKYWQLPDQITYHG